MADEINVEKAATGNMLVHGAGQVARAKNEGALIESKGAVKVAKHLSDGMKVTLEGLNAVHSSRHVFGEGSDYSKSSKGRIGNS